MKKYFIFLTLIIINTMLHISCSECLISEKPIEEQDRWNRTYQKKVNELKEQGYSRCECKAGDPDKKKRSMRNIFFNNKEQVNGSVTAISMGSGGLLEEYVIAEEILKNPQTTELNLFLIDPAYDKESDNYSTTIVLIQKFTKAINEIAKEHSKQISISFYSNAQTFFKNERESFLKNPADLYLLVQIDLAATGFFPIYFSSSKKTAVDQVVIKTPKKNLIIIEFGPTLGDISIYAQKEKSEEENKFIRNLFFMYYEVFETDKENFINDLPVLYTSHFNRLGNINIKEDKLITMKSRPHASSVALVKFLLRLTANKFKKEGIKPFPLFLVLDLDDIRHQYRQLPILFEEEEFGPKFMHQKMAPPQMHIEEGKGLYKIDVEEYHPVLWAD